MGKKERSEQASRLMDGTSEIGRLYFVCPVCGTIHDDTNSAVTCVFSHGGPKYDDADEQAARMGRIAEDIQRGYVNGKEGKFTPIPVLLRNQEGNELVFDNPKEMHRFLKGPSAFNLSPYKAAWELYKFVCFLVVAVAVTQLAQVGDFGEFAVVVGLLALYIAIYTQGKKRGEVMLAPLSSVDAGIIIVVNSVLYAILSGARR